MSERIEIEYLNAVHMRVKADAGMKSELSEFFAFKPEGYQFSPKYKARVWDGTIRLFQPMRPVLYVGLYPHLKKFCEQRDYILDAPSEIAEKEIIENGYVEELAESINCKYKPRDYQIEYIEKCVKESQIVIIISNLFRQIFNHLFNSATLLSNVWFKNINYCSDHFISSSNGR